MTIASTHESENLLRISGRSRHAKKSGAQRYLESAIAAVFGTRKSESWAMISAYFDESGTHDSSPVFVVAGLLSTPRSWECLTREWQQALDEEGVKEFHATSCATGHGKEFKGWGDDRRNSFYRRMVDIIWRHATGRTWTAVIMHDYRQLFGTDALPYSLGAFGCVSRIRAYSLRLGGQPFVPYVFEQGGKNSQILFGEFLELKQRESLRMGALTVGDRRRFLPLQAADLHAYEIYKYFADQWSGSKRPVRRSLWKLLEIKQVGGGGYLLHGRKLEQIIDAARQRQGEVIEVDVDRLDQQHGIVIGPPP